MMSSTIIGCLLSVVALGTLVASDPGTVVQLHNIKLTHTENDYYGEIDIKLTTEGKKNTIVNVVWPMKQELPPTMEAKFYIVLGDNDPIEHSITLCDAFEDELIGKTFKEAGEPKETFPQGCPIPGGEWRIVNWDPPTEKLPPGVDDGPITGYVDLLGENELFLFRVEFEGEIFHAPPGLGKR